MANPYTRQSSYTDGDTIAASDSNDEFAALVLFANNHTHNGSAGEGAGIYNVNKEDAVNNGVTNLTDFKHTTSGTPATGIGSGISFTTETSASNNELGMEIQSISTTVTGGSEDFDLVVNLMEAGATAATRLRLSSAGALTLTDTGSDTLVLKAGSITDSTGAISFGNENLSTTGTLAAAAITGTGILSIDSTTESSSTVTGSIHTDGGLGVAKKVYLGSDLNMLSGKITVSGSGSSNGDYGLKLTSTGTNFEPNSGFLEINHPGSGALTGGFFTKFIANSVDYFTVKGTGDITSKGNIDLSTGHITLSDAGDGNSDYGLKMLSTGTNFEPDSGFLEINHAGTGALTGGFYAKFIANSVDYFTVRGNGDLFTKGSLTIEGAATLNLPLSAGASGTLWNDSGTVKVA